MKNFYLCVLLIFIINGCKKNNPSQIITKRLTTDSLKLNAFKTEIEGYEYTELGLALKSGDIFTIKKLVDNGASINDAKKNEIYEYDGLYVAIENDHPEIVELLLHKKANPNQLYTDDGLTPLSLASKLNLDDIATILIKNGANVNGANVINSDYKITPLFYAIENDNIKLAELLLKNGADITLKNEKNKSALTLAIGKGTLWKNIFYKYSQRIATNNVWDGIYYYKPYDSPDSLGNFYAKIDKKNSEFGYSGSNSYHYKISVETKEDSLLMHDKTSGFNIGIIFRKNNGFWIKSDLISKFKNTASSQYFKLKYASSAEEIN